MKRILLSALLVGVTSSFVGCGDDTTKKETTVKASGPGGSETKKITETDKKTGDARP